MPKKFFSVVGPKTVIEKKSEEPRFFFALSSPGQAKSLKQEMQLCYPEWKLAYSQGDWITFKTTTNVPWPKPYLALIYGLSRGEVTAAENTGPETPRQGDVVSLNTWGLEKKWRVIVQTPEMSFAVLEKLVQMPLPPEVPSRAWLKIAQACEVLNLNLKGAKVLEYGAAPGGATAYLLSQGTHVVAVDPGLLDQSLMDNPDLKFYQKSYQQTSTLLKEKFDWILSDMNLSPAEIMPFFLNSLVKDGGLRPQGFLLTLKINQWGVLKKMSSFAQSFQKHGYKTRFFHLPAHHREVLLVAY
jgi:hypothetical protein